MTVDTAYASVRRVTVDDQQTLLDLLTRVFMDDIVTGWLFPDPTDRASLLPHYYSSLLDHSASQAYLFDDGSGGSVWLTLALGQTPYDTPSRPLSEVSVFGDSGRRLQSLSDELAKRHPDHAPHFYLATLGIDPQYQRTQLDATLLRHQLDWADAQQLGVYLEAGSPHLRALYKRHGFTDTGAPVLVADSPPLWPMWRDPIR